MRAFSKPERITAANHDLAAGKLSTTRGARRAASHHRRSSPANRLFEGGGLASRSLDTSA